MNSWLTIILTFFGSIGLVLYGMKLVSEGLQRIAGDHLRGVLSDFKGNKVLAVLSGIFSTSIVQSSSATTLMVVSSVNAGLITLAQAIAVIMGINVGTTVTTWLIALFGFHISIFPFLLPIIAIGLPLYNSSQNRWNSIGVLLIGFALMFFGITVMKESVLVDYVISYSNPLVYALAGLLLTMIVQSSGVTFTIALVMSSSGLISFEMACAMLVGANIGTCVVPLILSRSANVMAKRAVLSHLLFNLFGAIWVLILFKPLCDLIDFGPMEFNLAAFHTLFNLVNLCILVGFTKYFEEVVAKLCPETEEPNEDTFRLQFISSGMMDSGEIALSQAKQETNNYAGEIYKMFGLLREMLEAPNGSVSIINLHDRINKMEDDSDDAEKEIAEFLSQINTNTLSTEGDQVSFSIFKMIDDMESIADCIQHMAITIKNKSEQRIIFNNEMMQNLAKMISLTDTALFHMATSIQLEEVTESVLNKAYNNEDEINNYRNQLRNYILENIDKKSIEFRQGSLYMELVNECEKIGDYVINVLSSMPR